ncbi:MAG: recombinase family protein [Lachnospiraceae bacterium]|jgi:site-specific DNA recombinase|nr:recombinase family protein [Lachnospiraceae bacterium]
MSIHKYEILNQERKIRPEKQRVAAYCRVSTDREDQANSFENQCRFFRQYIERNPDWELCGIFADEGISGTNTKKRREFNRMMESAKNGEVDLIITKEISRFARNTLDSIFYTRELKKYGVGVFFLNDNIHTLDGDAELRLAIMASIAQEESRRTSERVKWGQKRRMEQGVVFGRSLLGYDVKDGKLYINEEGARIVRLIFHKFVNEGKGTHVIARELQEAGFRPMYVGEWQNTGILRILRNEKYCGDLVQKKTYTADFLSHEKKINQGQEEFVIIRDHHEPIVSRQMFDQANNMLDARACSQKGKPKHSSRYVFSGKIKCDRCGASLVARYKKRKDGSRYQAWRCYEAVRHGRPSMDQQGNQRGCLGESIRNEELIGVMRLIFQELPFHREKIIEELTRLIGRVLFMESGGMDADGLWGSMEELRQKRTRLIELYTGGEIEREEFQLLRVRYEEEMKKLRFLEKERGGEQILGSGAGGVQEDMKNVIQELVNGVPYEDEFYAQILEKIVIYDRDHMEVWIKMLPDPWSFVRRDGFAVQSRETKPEAGSKPRD